MSNEMDRRQIELGDQVRQCGEVALEQAEHPHNQQAAAWVARRVVRVEEPDEILDSLVRNHPPDKKDVGPVVVELLGHEALGLVVEVREVGHDGEDGRSREAQRFEIATVEGGVAKCQIAAAGIGPELASSPEALPRERAVDADEVLGRRDVVVDERHPIGQRIGRSRRLGPEREVVEEQVVGTARVDQLPIVTRQRFETWIGGLDEDIGLIAGSAQHPLRAKDFVADGIAVAERRKNLVNGGLMRTCHCVRVLADDPPPRLDLC